MSASFSVLLLRKQEGTTEPKPASACDHDYATPPRNTEEQLAVARERIDELERKLHQYEVDGQREVERLGWNVLEKIPKCYDFTLALAVTLC